MLSKRVRRVAWPPRITRTRLLIGSGWGVVPLKFVVQTDLNRLLNSIISRAYRRSAQLSELLVPSYLRLEFGLAATSALACWMLYLPGSVIELQTSLPNSR